MVMATMATASSFQLKAFGVLCFLQLVYFEAHSMELNPSWYACKIEFKDKDQKIKAITECAAKTNYKLPPDDSLESIQAEMKKLSSSNFDDMCFSKCLFESEKLIKDGKINVAELGNYFKDSNITEPLLKEYNKIGTECVAEIEPKFKDEKEIPCKMYAMIDYCYFQKFEEHKNHFEEICMKSST